MFIFKTLGKCMVEENKNIKYIKFDLVQKFIAQKKKFCNWTVTEP